MIKRKPDQGKVCLTRQEVSAFKKVWHSYRTNAHQRDLSWDLTFEQFLDIVTKSCYLCDSPPINKVFNKHRTGSVLTNGIDRIDNTLGYFPGNVATCCRTCNIMKASLGLTDFLKKIKLIVKFMRGKT